MEESEMASYVNRSVQTPNGEGFVVGLTWLNNQRVSSIDTKPDAMMVRHKPKVEIDAKLCAQVVSKSNLNGWLVVYKVGDIK